MKLAVFYLKPAFICLLFLAGCQRLKPPDDNLLSNSGFEKVHKGKAKDWTTSSWQAGEANVKILYDGSVYRSGSRSLRIVHPLSNDTSVMQTLNVEPDTVYRISGWIKTQQVQSAQGRIGATMCIDGTWTMSSDLKGDNPWTYKELWVRTAKNQTRLKVACRLGYWYSVAVGSAWFDDVMVEKFAKPPPDVALSTISQLPSQSVSRPSFALRGLFFLFSLGALLLIIILFKPHHAQTR